MTKPVLVIGATGNIGRPVVDELLRTGVPVRALTRSPDTAALPSRAEVYTGDLTSPESLDRALDGVSAVFLLWTAAPATVHEVIERITSHTKRVVFMSSPHQTPHPFFQQSNGNAMAVLHANIEQSLADAGADVTILRPGMFASNCVNWWAPQIRAGDVVRWPYAAAETAPIDERDVAAVAARALIDNSHIGGDYVLTGPESLSHADQVRIIGEVIGRDIAYDETPAETFRRESVAAGWPAPIVDMLLAAWAAASAQPAYVTDCVCDVTGTPARAFREWTADHRTYFTT